LACPDNYQPYTYDASGKKIVKNCQGLIEGDVLVCTLDLDRASLGPANRPNRGRGRRIFHRQPDQPGKKQLLKEALLMGAMNIVHTDLAFANVEGRAQRLDAFRVLVAHCAVRAQPGLVLTSHLLHNTFTEQEGKRSGLRRKGEGTHLVLLRLS
jgi:hypothetical protein